MSLCQKVSNILYVGGIVGMVLGFCGMGRCLSYQGILKITASQEVSEAYHARQILTTSRYPAETPEERAELSEMVQKYLEVMQSPEVREGLQRIDRQITYTLIFTGTTFASLIASMGGIFLNGNRKG